MVHRSSDSRLLVNLLDHEKEYSKQLSTLLDKSQSSLASFSAYASASAPPTSQIIIQVAGALAGADEALRRYAVSLEQWQEQLKSLKALEDEVGNVMRDREILVTRLIKLSKSQKPTRDSILASSSTSTLTKLPEVLTSTKLAAAQSELQACEAHLAIKERELDAMRNSAFASGLSARCKALVECGWTWGEMGKEGLRALETMEGSLHTSNGNGVANGYALTSPTLRAYKPLPEGPSSDLSSIGPSQSASQTTHGTTEPIATPHARLFIPPAHSISDHTFPVEEEQGGGSSADEEEGSYEVRENERFGKRSSKSSKKRSSNMGELNDSHDRLSSSSSVPPGQPPKRTRRTSGSVLGSIAAFFHRTPADHEQRTGNDSSPTKKQGRWQTRTDKHLIRARKGKGKETSSDEDLTIKQRSPVAGLTHAMMLTSDSSQKLKKSPGEPSRRTAKALSMTHIEPVDLNQGVLSDGGVDKRTSRRMKKARRASADHVMSEPETLPQIKKKTKLTVNTSVVEHRGKDASPTTLSPPSPVKIRKPSLGHAQKPNISLPAALPTEAPLSLSRNSSLSKRSITSAVSAPVNLSTTSTKSKATVHLPGSSPLNPATRTHKRSASLDARPEDIPVKSASKKHRRAQSTSNQPTSSSRTQLPGNQLMSIVEDVAQQNRESRYKQDPNLMLFVAKAPPPISASTDFLKLPDGPIHVPQHVAIAHASTSSLVKSLPSRDKTASQHSIPLTPTVSPPTAPIIHVPSPDMKPLRSAMRNTSRSPSPIVLSLPHAAVASSTSTLQLPLGPAKAPPSPLRKPPADPVQPMANGVVTDDDTSSISSYETTNDVLVEEPEEEDDHGTPNGTPTLPTPKNQSPPVPPPKEIPASGSDGSQLSRSTASTTVVTSSTHPPTRRKSVRMSLPPTFSVTPPAIDEDDSYKGHRYDPWPPSQLQSGGGWRSNIRAPAERDTWNDSSESEDEEYSRAKRLLRRLSRKK